MTYLKPHTLCTEMFLMEAWFFPANVIARTLRVQDSIEQVQTGASRSMGFSNGKTITVDEAVLPPSGSNTVISTSGDTSVTEPLRALPTFFTVLPPVPGDVATVKVSE